MSANYYAVHVALLVIFTGIMTWVGGGVDPYSRSYVDSTHFLLGGIEKHNFYTFLIYNYDNLVLFDSVSSGLKKHGLMYVVQKLHVKIYMVSEIQLFNKNI